MLLGCRDYDGVGFAGEHCPSCSHVFASQLSSAFAGGESKHGAEHDRNDLLALRWEIALFSKEKYWSHLKIPKTSRDL